MAEHSTHAQAGFGTELWVDRGSGMEQVFEVVELEPGDPDVNEIDVTHLSSPDNYDETIPGRKLNGMCTGKINYNPSQYSIHGNMRDARGDKDSIWDWEVRLPGGLETIAFSGWVKTFKKDSLSGDSAIVVSFEIKQTGAPVFS